MTTFRSIVFFLLTSLNCFLLKGAVFETDDLAIFKSAIEHLDSSSIVLFDLDYTLLTPCDAVLLPCGHHLRQQYQRGLGTNRCEFLESIIALESEEKVTDSGFLTIIQELEERGITAIGLTALSTGTYGKIQSLEDWRLNALKRLGIDFSKLCELKNSTTLNTLPQNNGNYPLFKDGVLFTNRQAKGKVLAAFLDLLDHKPQKIVVIDDSLRYLKTIEQAACELGIECCSFHYRAAEKLSLDFNEAVGKFQFLYLVENEQWLSDDQARKMIGQ